MELKSIEIQGMHKIQHIKYDLSRFNYFYGKNGSGKSTVLQAIQLALLGYIPGTDKNKTAIFRHSNGSCMSVKLEMSDSSYIYREWKCASKEIKAQTVVFPAGYDISELIGKIQLPILDFNEFIGLSANKLKDWFIEFLPESSSTINWTHELRSTISGVGKILDDDFVSCTIDYVLNHIPYSGIRQIREVNQYLKSQQSFVKSNIERIKSTIQSLVYYSDCDMSVDPDTLNQKIKVLMNSISKYSAMIDTINRNKSTQEQIDGAKKTLELIGAYTIEDLEDDIVALTSSITAKSKELATIQYELITLTSKSDDNKRILSGNGICNYTNEPCDIILSKQSEIRESVASLSKEIEDMSHRFEQCKEELSILENSKYQTESKLQKLHKTLDAINHLNECIDHSVDNYTIEDLQNKISNCNTEIAETQNQIAQILANKKYEELSDKELSKELFKNEQNLEILKIWIKHTDVNGLQQVIMMQPFLNFGTSATKYLQMFFNNDPDISVSFNLESKANSFSIGIFNSKQNSYVQYELLSSGEKCLLMLSILLAIADDSNNNLPLVMVDDLLDHLDPDRIDDCFKTLYSIHNVQVLLAGVQKCNHPDSEKFVVKIGVKNG